MEAVPRLPMISFDLKVSPEPASFGPKLKQYIADAYNEDPDSYANEIRQLESLRASAVRPLIDVTGCQTLKRYFCQLYFLQSRFPMGKGDVCAVTFSWRDIYASMVCSLADIKFELVSILYNIGALHTQLGAADSRTTSDGMKIACTHFQCAAWAFQHLRQNYPQPAGVDLAPEVMQYMHQLCLAQAQECILEKSMLDNRKATIIAKVAVQVVDFYNQALNTLQTGGDEGSIAETVGSKIYKEWSKYLKFKIAYHTCISLLYQGQQAEEQQKMGERVAFYHAASQELENARKLSKGLDQQSTIMEAITFTMDVVEGKKKAASNENEFIYHEEVPERDTLQLVKGASLVKGIPFNFNDVEVSGPDLFGRLVPMQAHEASSIYSEEKAQLLRRIIAQVEEKDAQLESFISSFQLETIEQAAQVIINSAPMTDLPQEIVDRAALLDTKTDVVKQLVDVMAALANLYHDVESMLEEINNYLQEEEVREKEYQTAVGTRPPSMVATELKREAGKYSEAHSKANESNQTLHRAMTLHMNNLKLLALPLDELRQHIPTIKMPDPNINIDALKELSLLINKIEEMRKQRVTLVAQLRESINNDDVTEHIVTKPSDQPLGALFSQEMEKHQHFVKLIEQNMIAQDNIMKAMTDAYARHSNTRKTIIDLLKQRETTIHALVSSYDAYEDLIAKANKGIDFYKKLETNVSKLLQRVKSTCKVQEEEREVILAKNTSYVPPSQPTIDSESTGPKLKDYLATMKRGDNLRQPNVSTYYNPTVPTQQFYKHLPPSATVANVDIPPVRPAPVGSEGTSEFNKLDDKTTIQSYYIPSTSVPYSSGYSIYNANTYSYNQNYANTSDATIKNLEERMAALMPKTNQQPYIAPGTYYGQHTPYVDPNTGNSNYSEQYYTSDQSTYTSSVSQTYTTNKANYPTSNLSNQYISSTNTANIPYMSHTAATCVGNTAYMPSSAVTCTANMPYMLSTQNPACTASTPYVPQVISCTANTSYVPHTTVTCAANTPYMSQVTTCSASVPSYPPQVATCVANYNSATNLQYSTGNYPQYATQYNSLPTNQYPQTSTPSFYANNPQPNPAYPSNQQDLTPSAAYPTTQNVNDTSNQHITYPQPSNQPNATVTQSLTYPQPSIYSNPNQHSATILNQQQMYSQQYDTSNQHNSTIPNQQHTYPQSATNTKSTYPVNNVQPTTSDASIQSHTSYFQYPVSTSTATTESYNYNPVNYYYQSPYQSSVLPSAGNPLTPSTYYNHPGYGFDPSTGQYVYSSGFQNTNNENNQNVTINHSITPDTTHYTSAGKYSTTQTPSEQYSQQQPVTPTSVVNTSTENYYSLPYGHPGQEVYMSPYNPNQIQPQSPLTYVSSNSVNLNTTNTSMKNAVTSTQEIVTKNKQSNIDLLSDIDFNIPYAPLKPETKAETKQEYIIVEKSTKSENFIQENNKVTIVPKKEEINNQDTIKAVKKDPLADPDVLNQFTQEIEKFEKFVENLSNKTLNGPTPLDLKWKELQDLQERDAQHLNISVARCYPVKNRFPDILPYDYSRVEMPSTKDDYINASHIKNISKLSPNFIMTQAPLHTTLADFWVMVWEQQCEIIVCLLNQSELQDVYIPTEKGQDLVYGRFKLSLESINIKPNWIERTITICLLEPKMTRVIIHLQFTSWPGMSFPASPGPFLAFVCELLTYHSHQRSHEHSIVVHCDSGIGRSGLLCLLAAYITQPAPLPDIVKLVAKLSQQRKQALRDREHLKFAYQAVLYHAQDLLMKRGILTSRSTFEESIKPKTHTRHPSQDLLLGPTVSSASSQIERPVSQQSMEYPSLGRRGSNISQSSLLSDGSTSSADFKIRSKQQHSSDTVKTNDPLLALDPLWSLKKSE